MNSNQSPTPPTVRALRWICWAVTVLCCGAIAVKGWDHIHNPLARVEWILSFIASTGNILLLEVERRRKRAVAVETQ